MNQRRQDDTQPPAGDYDPRGEAPSYPARRGPRRQRNPARKLVPALILVFFGVLFARQQVPAFAEWWERTFNPQEWQARDTCRQAAMAELRGGRYARLRDPGELHRTQDGPSITGMQFSALDVEGGERRVEYNCYLDAQGRLFRLDRVAE